MRIFVFLLLLLFCTCSTNKNNLKVKGSDTEVNLAVLLAEDFYLVSSELLVSVSGGGSGLGITSLLNGNADLANSSRKMKPEELELFRKKGIEIDSFVFAQDAIAFVVSKNMPIDSISIQDIAKLLSVEFNNWSKLIAKDLPVNLYGRQSNSGTHDFVKEILGIQFSPHAKQMNGNAQIIEALKVDASGFGYVSAGYVMHGNAIGVKVLRVYQNQFPAVSPLDALKIASGEYFFQRPLIQYFRKADMEKVKPFLEFEKSAKGAKIIKESGYYPVQK